jgi:Spy/CpxP family protein refolding chaperone
MRRTPWFKALMLIAALVLGGTAVGHAVETGQDGARQQRRESHLKQRLGLTDDQVQAIRQIHQQQAGAARQHWQTLRQAQSDLRRLVLSDADEASIQAKQAEVQALMAESLQRRVASLKAIAPILTPEQREQFAQMLDHGRRHGHRPHGQPRS